MPSDSKRASSLYDADWPMDRLQTIAFVVGLSLYWPFFRRFGFLPFFTGYKDPSGSMWATFSTVMVVLAICCIVAVVARRVLEPMLGARCACATVAAFTSLSGYALVLLAPHGSDMSEGLRLVGAVLLGTGYAVLTFAWMWLVTRQRGWRLFIYLVLSYFASTLYAFVVYAPEAVVRALFIAMPIVSALAWYGCSDMKLWPEHPSDGDVASDDGIDYTVGGLVHLPIPLIALFGLFLIAGSILVGLMQFSADSVLIHQRAMTSVVSGTLVIGIWAASWRVRHVSSLIQTAWVLLALIFFIGTLGILAGSNDMGRLGASVIEACLGCFELFLWYLLVIGVIENRLSVLLVFGIGFALFKVVPNYVGKYVIPAAMASAEVGGAVIDSFVIVVMALLLGVTFLFIGRNAFLRLPDETSGIERGGPGAEPSAQHVEAGAGTEAPESTTSQSAQLAFRDTLEPIARKAELTPREIDVMELMAQGYSYQAIADGLFLSLGTVQWHTKNIYRKLGVHTKQELIELVRA